MSQHPDRESRYVASRFARERRDSGFDRRRVPDSWRTHMLRFAPASAGRQGRTISWLLIAALLISAFSSVLPSAIQPQVAKAADRMIKMPFASGANWTISQGYNTNPNNGGSHYNCPDYPGVSCSAQWMYKYSFDLVRSDGNTAGQPVLSPVNGPIRWIDPSYGGMSINLGNGWAVAYFHTDLAPGLAAGQSIVQGQWLGQSRSPAVAATAASRISTSRSGRRPTAATGTGML